ncbi:chromatin assembly factor 1 subunit B [Capronia coronata CBS 617.96]|uniref:Chromatin assembly factor 1 subunit B n=1 Tax=Capronia coronata CBS 617.96 TaxID=1182541 RepID=W9Z2Z1_9EURO|nr:chromatin assembly factor 1 subunit B [Capronia coronata CBS 617.96]EXJ95936.1 chromatin assembly factor 1 subunit B [Capronia coronata CBS 617.96]
MKAGPLLITWHNESQPIYSVHFDPHGKGRLATAGNDNNVRLWSIEAQGDERKVTYLSTLTRHTQPVNVVRFCPKGEMLASAGDDGNILLWVPSESSMTTLTEEHADDKETWRIKHMCRTSSGAEIYDLAWSPDGQYFITGGVDNTARIFSAHTGAMIRQIAEHNHFVQGVAWDPLNEFVATQSSDRSVHIYALKLKDGTPTLSSQGKFNKMDLPARRISSNSPAPPADLPHRTSNAGGNNLAIASPAPSNPGTPLTTALPMDPPMLTASRRSSFGSSPSFRRSASPAPSLPLPAVRPEISSPSLNAAMGLAVKNTNLYHNETMTSFFRRLTFSPDGSLLFTPAGHYKTSFPTASDPTKTTEDVANTVYIYTRAGFNKPPVAHLPGHKKPSVAVRCSPILYTLRTTNKATNHITIDTSSAAEEIPLLPDPIVPQSSSTFKEPAPLSITTSAPESMAAPSPKAAVENDAVNPASTPAFSLPYRMVYAVATQDAVFVYDTQQTTPLCVVSNLHYAAFTDLTWSNDGLTLLMSSTDGYCSTLAFQPGELGQVYTGPHPTYNHPVVSTSIALPTSSSSSTPIPTPTAAASPSLTKASPAPVPPSHPSPAPFILRPGSPARSNSQSSIATMASIQASNLTNHPTPTMGHVPLVTAASSGPPVAVPPMSTPPQTPASLHGGHHSATSSVSGGILGKRDVGTASESEKEESKSKRRRIAPTLVGPSGSEEIPKSEEKA